MVSIPGIEYPCFTLNSRSIPLTESPRYFGDENSSSRVIVLTGRNLDVNSGLFIHDSIVAPQCSLIRRLVDDGPDNLHVENVPHLPSFIILLEWFYGNDEDVLYKGLCKAIRDDGIDMLHAFETSCEFWGVTDSKIIKVVKKVNKLETNNKVGLIGDERGRDISIVWIKRTFINGIKAWIRKSRSVVNGGQK